MPNYYELLGVSPNATIEEIHKAYKALMKKVHPDLHKNDPDAEEKAKLINNAYATLKDPSQRAFYDMMLKMGRYTTTSTQKESTKKSYGLSILDSFNSLIDEYRYCKDLRRKREIISKIRELVKPITGSNVTFSSNQMLIIIKYFVSKLEEIIKLFNAYKNSGLEIPKTEAEIFEIVHGVFANLAVSADKDISEYLLLKIDEHAEKAQKHKDKSEFEAKIYKALCSLFKKTANSKDEEIWKFLFSKLKKYDEKIGRSMLGGRKASELDLEIRAMLCNLFEESINYESRRVLDFLLSEIENQIQKKAQYRTFGKKFYATDESTYQLLCVLFKKEINSSNKDILEYLLSKIEKYNEDISRYTRAFRSAPESYSMVQQILCELFKEHTSSKDEKNLQFLISIIEKYAEKKKRRMVSGLDLSKADETTYQMLILQLKTAANSSDENILQFLYSKMKEYAEKASRYRIYRELYKVLANLFESGVAQADINILQMLFSKIEDYVEKLKNNRGKVEPEEDEIYKLLCRLIKSKLSISPDPFTMKL